MRHMPLRPLLLLASLLFGCSSGLRVNVVEPARVAVGPAKKLVLVQSEGRTVVQDTVLRQLEEQSRQDGYFTFEDHTYTGATVKLAGNTVEVRGEKAIALAEDEIGLRIDVLGWDAPLERSSLQVLDENGNRRKKIGQDRSTAKLILGVTAFDSAGRVLLAQEEYSAQVESPRARNMLRELSRLLVDRVLQDLTPRRVTHRLRMDDEDAAQKGIVEVAEQGHVDEAFTQLTAYVEQHPESAVGWYNLAVLLDARGEYEKALEHYARAISLTPKDSYVEMKDACARRQASLQALRQ